MEKTHFKVKVPPPQFCQCSDPGCPICGGRCHKIANQTVFRSDMGDRTGTCMCNGCAEDCLDSGLFYTTESTAAMTIDFLVNERDPCFYETLKPKAKAKASKWEWSAGRKVEKEHTSSNKDADIIASHHLKERPDYYRKLKSAGLADELKSV